MYLPNKFLQVGVESSKHIKTQCEVVTIFAFSTIFSRHFLSNHRILTLLDLKKLIIIVEHTPGFLATFLISTGMLIRSFAVITVYKLFKE